MQELDNGRETLIPKRHKVFSTEQSLKKDTNRPAQNTKAFHTSFPAFRTCRYQPLSMMETVVAVRVFSTSDGTSDSSSTSDSTSSVHQCEDSVVSPPSEKSSVLRLRSLSANSVSFLREVRRSVRGRRLQFSVRRRLSCCEYREIHLRDALMTTCRTVSFIDATCVPLENPALFPKWRCDWVHSDQRNFCHLHFLDVPT